MSNFWSLSINNDSLIECALRPYADQISQPPGGAGGWGLGYYYSGELLRRIEPQEQGEPLIIRELVAGLKADLAIMHTRKATVGPLRRENTHPFRFKGWLFAHNGTLPKFEAYQDRVRNTLPQFILRNVQGDTDSEYLFHLFISFLYDAGLFGKPDLGTEPIRDALGRAFATVDEFAIEAGEEPAPGSAVVSDGYSLVVLSKGIPVDYVLIEGVRDCSVCRNSVTDSCKKETERFDHEDLRAVLITSSDSAVETPAGFHRMAEKSFLTVTKSYSIEFSPFGRF